MPKGLTLKQLLKLTPRKVHSIARYVRSTEARKIRTEDGSKLVAKVRSLKGYGSGTLWEAIIEGGPVLSSGYVKVSCGCENYMYTAEYALSQKGAADIIHSNGKPSYSTNPQFKPMICKHLVKLASTVLAKRM